MDAPAPNTPPDATPGRPRRALSFVKRNWTWLLVLGLIGYLVYTVNPPVSLDERRGTAPAFVLPTMTDERFDLSAHRGDVVVVTFWATWCPACRTERPMKESLYADLQGEDVAFVHVSVNESGLDAVREFAEGRDMAIPQVADRALLGAFGGSGAIPATFLIDRQGQIRYQHEGLLAKPALRGAVERLLEEPA
ncbi:MAG: redoxin domain-containing protein [Bacteroidetes bacterium]|jgi:peroxiredoxin|nr:redoxin domain-containing protein [Bacteroidota bacterium]